MKNRLMDRVRHSNPHLESFPTERLGRLERGLSLEIPPLIDDDTINQFQNNQLMEAINKIEKENKIKRLENLLYSRYLRRVNSSKMIETFDEYEDESDVILSERHNISNQTAIHAKLPEIARRLSVKKSSNVSSKVTPLWSKLVTNWREYIYTPFLLRVEKEKISIAAYEIEQTQLDLERMKANAQLALDHLDDILRAAEFDVISQEILNNDFEKNINKFLYNINEKNLNNSHLIIPAELMINRINKRIRSDISLIGLLHINTANTQLRIRSIDVTINALFDLREKMDEIDINFVRTRKIDYLDTYEKLDKKYKLEKSSQYPLFHQLHEWKKFLSKQEKEEINYEYKYKLLENRLEKLNNEINSINSENKFILNENYFLRIRIDNVKKVPTITDYAHIIKQTKQLKHEFDIWTKRVNIAETLLSQLKRQTKSPNVLPLLKPTVDH